MDSIAKFILYIGASLLLGSIFVRRVLLDCQSQFWFLFPGLLMLVVGGVLSIWLPLLELELNVSEVVFEYVTTVAAGRAVLIMILGAVILIAFEINDWSRAALFGAASMTLWGLVGIGHGGDHSPWIRLTHVFHAGSMVIWLSGIISVWRAEDKYVQALRFVPFAAGAAGTLLLSGALLVMEHAGIPLLIETEYVQILVFKFIVFGLLILIAAHTHFYFGPDADVRRKVLADKVSPFLIAELIFLLLILAVTAKLSITPMPGY